VKTGAVTAGRRDKREVVARFAGCPGTEGAGSMSAGGTNVDAAGATVPVVVTGWPSASDCGDPIATIPQQADSTTNVDGVFRMIASILATANLPRARLQDCRKTQ
jgi:hypothetical protein